MTPPESPDRLSDSDQQWLDRLAGKLTPASDAAALREADALRRAILDEKAMQDAAGADADQAAQEAGAQRLLFALRREGLLASGGETATAAPVRKPAWMIPSALAASVLVGFLALQALQFGQIPVSYDEPPTMRGEIQTVTLRDKAPKDRAEAVAGQLKAAGLSARLYQSGSKFVVDTDLVADKLEAAAATLQTLGLKDRAGQARIEIVKP